MTAIRRSFLGALLLLVLGSPAWAVGGEEVASASPASALDVAYDIYVGGIRLGEVTLSLRIQNDEYKAVSTLKTEGIVNAIWGARIEASANGTIRREHPEPALYYALSRHDGRTQQVTMRYAHDAPASILAEPRYLDEDRIRMSEDKTAHTLDPVSAMVSLATSLSAYKDGHCGTTLAVFDARRRYDVSLAHVGSANVTMDNGLYAGPVEVCRIGYRPIAGPRQKVIDGKIPDIRAWLTILQGTADPDRRFLLPLRIWVDGGFGIAVALASQVKLDGSPWKKP